MAAVDALQYRHDELRRALDIQRETVDVLHARANLILVATLAAAAFLGANSTDRWGSIGVAVGVTAILTTVGLFGAVLWPRKWGWYVSTEGLADDKYSHPDITLSDILAGALTGMGKCSARNGPQIRKLARLLVYEALAGGVTVAIWLTLAIP